MFMCDYAYMSTNRLALSLLGLAASIIGAPSPSHALMPGQDIEIPGPDLVEARRFG